MRHLLDFAGFVDRLNHRISRAVSWSVLLMVLIGAYNAIARSLERRAGLPLSSNSLLELQWYLFGIGFLLAAPYALRRGDHVRVDVVYDGLPQRGRAWIDLLGTLLLLLPFCVFGVLLSLRFVSDSIAQNEWSNDPGGLPRWPIKLFVPIGFALLGLQGIASAIRNVAALRVPATGGGASGE
jgi:TRAP-type mannitol/chloroaromatic compound transport system permease small subunit